MKAKQKKINNMSINSWNPIIVRIQLIYASGKNNSSRGYARRELIKINKFKNK